MRTTFARVNERLAGWVTRGVGSMVCAYLFAALALTALPQALIDSFGDRLNLMPVITWASQCFLQLVLLSVIMVGQSVQGRASERRAISDHNTLRAEHAEVKRILAAQMKMQADLARLVAAGHRPVA
ncbi:MAG: hypothetical protein P4L82_11940 [Ancalomicrobiaceae bacterium]|nr:hypothetical protein [Ancalomicrobiaceae bacterium]